MLGVFLKMMANSNTWSHKKNAHEWAGYQNNVWKNIESFVLSLLLVIFSWHYGMFWDFCFCAAPSGLISTEGVRGVWGRRISQARILPGWAESNSCLSVSLCSAQLCCTPAATTNPSKGFCSYVFLLCLPQAGRVTAKQKTCVWAKEGEIWSSNVWRPTFVTETWFSSIWHLKECPSFIFLQFF